MRKILILAIGIGLGGCAEPEVENDPPAVVRQEDRLSELGAAFDRVDREIQGVDSIFQPLPLLTPAEEEGLRRFPNAQQLAQARRLGIEPNVSDERLSALLEEGRLVAVEDTEYWVVRDLDYSEPAVIPATSDLLQEIGRRFQAALSELGAPPIRFEISSILRSGADQARLREVNVNAASGQSTHEYGTTVDIAYNSFAAPQNWSAGEGGDDPATRIVQRYGVAAMERILAQRALELKAVLGDVLLDLQREGAVMVTLERQQPVFHLTIAR